MNFEDNLIELMRNYPTLYRNKDKKHKSIIIKDNCWREIAGKLKKTPEECKNKWRNIRDNYKKNQNKKKTGSAASISKYDDERLKFIDDSFEERETISNINSRNILEVHDEEKLPIEEICSSSSTSSSMQMSSFETLSQQQSAGSPLTSKLTRNKTPQMKKKKRDSLMEEFRKNREERNNIMRQMSKKGNTPVHVFFSSMADVVCHFPPDKIAQIRLQVCNIVTEMELMILAQRETQLPEYSQHPFNMLQLVHTDDKQRETTSSTSSPQHSRHLNSTPQ